MRIARYSEDHGISESSFIEQLIAEHIGSPSEGELSVFQAYEAQKDAEWKAQKDDLPNSPKTGQDDGSPGTTSERPTFNQPEPFKPVETEQEDVPEEMKDYVDPHLMF